MRSTSVVLALLVSCAPDPESPKAPAKPVAPKPDGTPRQGSAPPPSVATPEQKPPTVNATLSPAPSPGAAPPGGVIGGRAPEPTTPPKPAAPAPVFEAAEIQSASIVFRTTDNRPATVHLNGRAALETGGLWSVSPNTAFDPAIAVDDWPPPGTQHGARAVKWHDGQEYVVGSIEARLAGGRYPDEPREALLKRVPHLGPDEHVLYVKARAGHRCLTGALRVKVVGADGTVYRHVTFHPPDSDEDPNASRWRTSIWFER